MINSITKYDCKCQWYSNAVCNLFFTFCSPLVFTLQALVNASFVDGDMDVISAAVSCLQSIFFAIKRAEDAVDAHITPVTIAPLLNLIFLVPRYVKSNRGRVSYIAEIAQSSRLWNCILKFIES